MFFPKRSDLTKEHRLVHNLHTCTIQLAPCTSGCIWPTKQIFGTQAKEPKLYASDRIYIEHADEMHEVIISHDQTIPLEKGGYIERHVDLPSFIVEAIAKEYFDAGMEVRLDFLLTNHGGSYSVEWRLVVIDLMDNEHPFLGENKLWMCLGTF